MIHFFSLLWVKELAVLPSSPRKAENPDPFPPPPTHLEWGFGSGRSHCIKVSLCIPHSTALEEVLSKWTLTFCCFSIRSVYRCIIFGSEKTNMFSLYSRDPTCDTHVIIQGPVSARLAQNEQSPISNRNSESAG